MELTIVGTVLGWLGGLVTSWWFSLGTRERHQAVLGELQRSQARDTEARELAERLLREVSALRNAIDNPELQSALERSGIRVEEVRDQRGELRDVRIVPVEVSDEGRLRESVQVTKTPADQEPPA